jgi:hypothetical protein
MANSDVAGIWKDVGQYITAGDRQILAASAKTVGFRVDTRVGYLQRTSQKHYTSFHVQLRQPLQALYLVRLSQL